MKIITRSLNTYLASIAVFVSFLFLGPIAFGEDAVIADPEHYTVVFENDKVRVIRITYGPGEKSVMHGHNAGVIIDITDTEFRMTFPDGTSEDSTTTAGTIVWDDGSEHLPENLTDEPAEVIYVEIKD